MERSRSAAATRAEAQHPLVQVHRLGHSCRGGGERVAEGEKILLRKCSGNASFLEKKDTCGAE